MDRIPFNRASLQGRELEYVREAFQGGHTAADGPFTRRCEEFLERTLGAPRCLLATSCTHALEMSALLLEPRPGDEVIVPAFTFVSTASAFALHGVRPVFVDVRPDTLNLDESKLEDLCGPRTRAVVPVHYGGVGCEMDALREIADRRGLVLIEDAAHALFARYRGRPLGSLGNMATLSFHETKNLTCGEGGCLVLNDARYVERAEILRQKGTDRQKFLRGEVDRYTWVDAGSSYGPSDILAAFLLAQIEQAEAVQSRRRAAWERYESGLRDWADANGVARPVVPAHCESSHHLYHLVFPDGDRRDAFLAHMKSRGVMAVFHYQPLHLSRMGQGFGGRPGQCPVAESVSGRLARLPLFDSLSAPDQDRVIDAVRSFTS